MLLNAEQLRAITRGVTRIEEEDGWFRLFRFTEAQAKFYADEGREGDYKKTFSASGVRLAFRTDSRNVSFRYRLGWGSSRVFAWFDVYVDGAMVSHFGSDGEEVKEGSAKLVLGEGEKNVEIYLPWSKATALSDVTLDDGASLTPLRRKHTMICFGDSITHGYDAIYPSLSYATSIARLLDADVTDKGIGGDRFCPQMLRDADPDTPDIITVAYGTNDWSGITMDEFRQNCPAFYRRLHELYPEARIYALSPIWRADCAKKTAFGIPAWEVHDLMKELCKDIPNVTLIRGWNLVPHHKNFYSDFSLHPNDLGFALYAQNLYHEIMNAD
ncbi:MAG: SGNH/GDSL hydrolase family protein [Clostridia bacterium]|nr:SGNH/GDSL hydrolase family protein [Clostridia bacterium]